MDSAQESKLDGFLSKCESLSQYSKLWWFLAIPGSFFAALLLNILTPTIADDFGYMYVYNEGATRVEGFGDIIRSQYNHYMLWGGRSVVHFIAQSLLLVHPIVADVLNSAMYLVYVFLIYWMITGRKKSSVLLFIFINFGIWFIQPAMGDTILWVTGSANYLWGTSMILLFLLPFRLYNVSQGKGNILFALLFLLYGVLAGWTNENTAGAMILLSIFFLVYYKMNGWKIPLWAITGLIGTLIGYLFMILAPGNAVRAGEAGEFSVFVTCYRFLMHSLTLFTDHGILVLIFLLLLGFTLYRGAKNKADILSLMFFISAIAGVYVMIFSPSFPPRAWFGVLTFIMIAIGILFFNLDYAKPLRVYVNSCFMFVGTFAFLFLFYLAFRDIYRFYGIYQERQTMIAEAKAKGNTHCQVLHYNARSKFLHTEEIMSVNLMKNYYGIEIEFVSSLDAVED